MSLRRPSLPLLFASAALALVPWIGLLAVSPPCHYSARHWGIFTSLGTGARALAVPEALAIELPLALLCIWVAQTSRPRQPLTTAHTDQEGALQ